MFIGCELGGVIDVSSDIGPSDTSSQPDEISPYDVENVLNKTLGISLSQDEYAMQAVKDRYKNSNIEKVLLEDVRSFEEEVNYADHNQRTAQRTYVVKTSLFLLGYTYKKEIVLLQTTKSYISSDGFLASQSVDVYSFYDMYLDAISEEDLTGVELVFAGDKTCGIYLPTANKMFETFDIGKLVEVKDFNKKDPLLITSKLAMPALDWHKKSSNDGFVVVTNQKNERYLAYYDSAECRLIKLSDNRLRDVDIACVTDMSEGKGRVVIAYKNAVAFYDLSDDDPFTPTSIITNKDMGLDGFTPIFYPVVDRNNSNRYVMAYMLDADSRLGFVTFDYDGNLTNSFTTEQFVRDPNDIYYFSFVGNIVYFQNVTEEYLGLNYSKYAVDVRKGRSNKPQLQSETFIDEMNITLDEFRYDVSSKAYPFVLGDQEGIAMEHGFGLSTVVDDIQTTWNFKQVSYNAETEDVVAYAYTFKGKTMPYIKGRLSVENDGVYLTPYNLDTIPVPAKTNTGFVKIKIDTTDLEALKEYASTFEKDNVVIGVEGMKITRQNGELSYLAEICEMFNGDYDYITRQNKVLDILKAYGAISDGCFELRPGETIVNASIEYEPVIYAAPLTPITHRTFKTVPALLDWYATYTSREQMDSVSVAQLQNTMYEQFTKQWTFDAEEFEKAVLEHFDVTLELLRESEYYKDKTSTYEYSSQSLWDLELVGISEYFQVGNYLQIFFWSYTTNENYCLTVLLDGESFRFVDIQARANAIYEAPQLFVTNLIPES